MIGPVLVLLGIILVARRWIDVVEVCGRSMSPALDPGDRLLIVRAFRTPRVGDIVLAHDPRDAGRELIKRVAGVSPEGVDLRGDNQAASTDTGTFGPIPTRGVQWNAVARYWPPRRIGRLAFAPGVRAWVPSQPLRSLTREAVRGRAPRMRRDPPAGG